MDGIHAESEERRVHGLPRLTALAEVVWTPKEKKDYANFLDRLREHLTRLQALDVNFRPLDPGTNR